MPECDYCGNRCDRIVLKLYKVNPSVERPEGRRPDANLYTHRAHIGPCCVLKVNEINWRPRAKTRA